MTTDITHRQLEVLALMAQGCTVTQAAERLYLSANTVRVHLREARWHLRAPNTTAAVATALHRGLISYTNETETA